MSLSTRNPFAGAADAGNGPRRARSRSMTERETRAYLLAREAIRKVRSTALALSAADGAGRASNARLEPARRN
jgi:hypothetical protein